MKIRPKEKYDLIRARENLKLALDLIDRELKDDVRGDAFDAIWIAEGDALVAIDCMRRFLGQKE